MAKYHSVDGDCDCACDRGACWSILKWTFIIIVLSVLFGALLTALVLSSMGWNNIRGLPCINPGDTNGDGYISASDCLVDPTIVANLTMLEDANSNSAVLTASTTYSQKLNATNPALTVSKSNNYLGFGSLTSDFMRILLGTSQIGVGTVSPHASALVHHVSTTKGFILPVMTTTQKNAISSPATGLLVYDATLTKLCIYNGSAWRTVTDS